METTKAQKFELTILADESSTEEQVEELVEDVQELVGRYLTFEVHDMGVQRLSYPITLREVEHEASHRLEFDIVVPAEDSQELFRSMSGLSRDERVIRYLLYL